MKWLPRIEKAADMMAVSRGDFDVVKKLIDDADQGLNKKFREAKTQDEFIAIKAVGEVLAEFNEYFEKAHDWALNLVEQEGRKRKD